ncbi:hypothetical protein NLJ89_g3405 [Agrocybe chaxingu]|uniref:E2 ubiquitin-conjugating enzyme n=1 Tax=Agrocybe chaxingu TaxID=84603 RepID=A0A9W8K9Z1_9AGAR|nr:hypothetical protein NLJ89_g3405 [Agrocybe chaxingu]
MTLKRIHREIADLKKEDLGPIVLEPSDSLYIWKGSIPGPQGSVYDGGIFNVEIVLPNDYPFSAPRVLFKTRIYHMNIAESGNICIDILKHNWSPALSLFKVMLSLSSLLTDPNPKDPLVPSIATQYTRNRKQHDATARQWTETYAKPPPPPTVQVSPPNKAKGKKRADTGPTNTVEGSCSSSGPGLTGPNGLATTGAGGSSNEVIVVLDSDGEEGRVQGRKRKRGSAAGSGTAEDPGDVVELVDSDDDVEVLDTEAQVPSKRTRKQKPATRRVDSASGASGSRRSARQVHDVIILDD